MPKCLLSFLIVTFIGCASHDPDIYPTKVPFPKYPRASNITVKDYDFTLSSVPIRTRVIETSPFFYDGKDTRFIYLKVLDAVYRGEGELIIPSGSTLFGVQDRHTGRYINITRYRKAGHMAWTLAYGIGEVASLGEISVVYLSKLSTP